MIDAHHLAAAHANEICNRREHVVPDEHDANFSLRASVRGPDEVAVFDPLLQNIIRAITFRHSIEFGMRRSDNNSAAGERE